jgi:glycosidase
MKKNVKILKSMTAVMLAASVLVTGGCGKKYSEDNLDKYPYEQELNIINDNVRNYYEVFVYSYCDTDGDGIGDFNGVTEKLDYIKDMGFNGIWLMPIMKSPSYHKYDTTDYCSVDDDYGTMEDFEKLLEEAHKRDIKVIIDLMINHTSNIHPWFSDAYSYVNELEKGKTPDATECPYVDYYNFVKEEDAGTGYHQVGSTDWYYEGQFVNTMPDLNLSSDAVRKEIETVTDFWLDKGVDGFRMDGVKYYTGERESNIEVLKWFNDYVKSKNNDAYIVTEVWDNYSEASKYLASGVNSTFNFSSGQSDGFLVKYARQAGGMLPVGTSLENSMLNIEKMTKEANPNSTSAEFLTNHDTGRTANMLGREDKVKLAYAMELFMSGNVFVYYGEEIGLAGSGSDPNFRAPMNWSATDRSQVPDGPKEMDVIENIFPALDEQQKDPNSINYFIKRCLRIRNENPEIARGTSEVIPEVEDEQICAITRTYNDSKLVILYNLSGEEKTVTVSKDTYGYKDIRGYVAAQGGEVTLKGDTVTMPALSVVVLK